MFSISQKGDAADDKYLKEMKEYLVNTVHR